MAVNASRVIASFKAVNVIRPRARTRVLERYAHRSPNICRLRHNANRRRRRAMHWLMAALTLPCVHHAPASLPVRPRWIMGIGAGK